MIFGIHGIISARDLAKLEVKDVLQQGSTYVITNPERNRSFTVDESEYATYVRKYIKLRPKITNHSRFFVNYQNGKCTATPYGVNKFHKSPKAIANFLNLDAENYTCHSFRRNLSKRRGKRSSTVVLSSVEESNPSKRNVGYHISEQNYNRSTEAIVTSTITSTINTFQVPIHQVQLSEHGPRHEPATFTTSMHTATALPTTFQSYYVQSHQVQPYPHLQYGTGTVHVSPNDVYIQPSNATAENIQ